MIGLTQTTEVFSAESHSEINGRNRPLLNLLPLYCSGRFPKWVNHLNAILGNFDGTHQSATGLSLHITKTRWKKSVNPLTCVNHRLARRNLLTWSKHQGFDTKQQEIDYIDRQKMRQARLRQKRRLLNS